MLEIRNVSKNYGKKEALRGVSFALPQGQIVGLFGENGAGKTTLMKSILGLTKFQGEITLDGAPITGKNIARLSFATSEHSFFPALNAKEHRDFYKAHFPDFIDNRFRALMAFFALPDDRPIGRCSTGQKNQFETVLALSQGADYILMDEPFAGNDVFNREDFYKVLLGLLTERETVLLSTHLLEEVQGFVGRALLLHEGKLIGDVDLSEAEDRGEDLMSIVHTHSKYATVFAALNRPIPPFVNEMMALNNADQCIPVAPYGRTATPALAHNVAATMKNADCILMQAHGAVAADAQSIDNAYLKACYIEEMAEVYHHILTITGGKEPPLLPMEEFSQWAYPEEIRGI